MYDFGSGIGRADVLVMRRSAVSLAIVLSSSLSAAALGGCASPTGEEDVSSEVSSDLSANDKTAYEFFVAKGLKPIQAAAIVGNLMQESSVLPTSVQSGGPGRGIAQWSIGARWDRTSQDNVKWYASTKGESATSLDLQLAFIWYELQNFPVYGLSRLRAASTLSQATVAFQNDFEVCGACNQSARLHDAQQVLSAYGTGSGGGGGGSGGTSGASGGCFSSTLGKEMPANACVQSASDKGWYQCSSGAWVDRWNDPTPCVAVYPL